MPSAGILLQTSTFRSECVSRSARLRVSASALKTLRVRLAIRISLQWDRDRDQGRNCNGHTSGIAGSRGVRFSSSTEQGIGDWRGSKTSNGDGLKASIAVWGHDGFIGG